MEKIKGKAFVLGDDVDTDQILPGYAMSEPYEKLSGFAMAGLPGDTFRNKAESACIIVGGRNFGCGSSREQAPIALRQAQVALVVARGFARIFRRNSINIGLPVLAAELEGKVKTGDEIEVDLENGRIETPNGVIQTAPLSESVRVTLEHGGLIPRVRAELGIEE